MDKELEQMLRELLALQTAPVTERAKRQAREKIIDLLTMEHDLNWQCVATPYDIVNEMIDLIPSDAEKFIVFFSLEFLEEMVKTRGIAKESILFVGDNGMETAFASHPDIYGVQTCIMSKDTGYQDGKLIFPETIFNFLKTEDENMKFGKVAVVMNPPYNDASMTSIYHHFINGAIEMGADHLVSINPSRWFNGGKGKGFKEFRERMMNEGHIRKLVHFHNPREVFPTVGIAGGVQYFHWDREYNGKCEFVAGGHRTMRDLNQYDIVVDDETAFPILDKVMSHTSKVVSETCLPRKQFGLPTNFKDFKDSGVKCICQGREERYVDTNSFTDKFNVKDKWKVVTGKVTSEGNIKDNGNGFGVLTNMFVVEPTVITLETYIVVNTFNSKTEADNFISYMNTKFFRFMLNFRLAGIDINKEKFAWVPDVEDYSAPWTDKELYKKFNLSRQEVAYIESKIKEIK